jgi:hypothetical protein
MDVSLAGQWNGVKNFAAVLAERQCPAPPGGLFCEKQARLYEGEA